MTVSKASAADKKKKKENEKTSHLYCIPGHFKSHFLSFQGDKETYIMWGEDAVFWSITQATEVNGFKPSLVERHHKFSVVGEEDLETGVYGLWGWDTLGKNGPPKRTVSVPLNPTTVYVSSLEWGEFCPPQFCSATRLTKKIWKKKSWWSAHPLRLKLEASLFDWLVHQCLQC